MKLSEITDNDRINVFEIIGNGNLGVADNIGKFGGQTREEFDRAMSIIAIFKKDLHNIVKKNEKRK